MRSRDGTLRVHWNDIRQEVWIADSPSGWLAAVNGDTGYAVVERHDIDHTHSYPGDASIIFYSSGPPRVGKAERAPAANSGGSVAARGAVCRGRGEQPHGGTGSQARTIALDTTWYPDAG